MSAAVYTIENECQDCYKCVRHCPVKAIRIVNAKASVIQDSCVACGECVKVCPAHAKKIRNDLPRIESLLASGDSLCASIAPSYAGYFKLILHADALNIRHSNEVLPDLLAQAILGKFLAQDGVSLAQGFQAIAGDCAQAAYAQTRPRERLTIDHRVGQT